MANVIQQAETDVQAAMGRLANWLKGSAPGAVLIADIERAAGDVPVLLTAFTTLVSNANAANLNALTQDLISDIESIAPSTAQVVGILNAALAIEPEAAQLLFNALSAAGYIAVQI